MEQSDRKEFTSVLRATMEVYDKTPSADALRVWWATMADVSLADFRRAMTEHVTTSHYAPKPADILACFKQSDGRPGPEEAWAMIPKDEDASIVWTQEMATAFGAAQPLIACGDMIGARMAFKEAYERELAQATGPVKWIPSLGMDKGGREAALEQAVVNNRLTADRALRLMPDSRTLQNHAAQEVPILPGNQEKIKQLASTVAPKQEEPEPETYNETELLEAAKQHYENAPPPRGADE